MKHNNVDMILHRKYGRTSNYRFPTFESKEELTDFYDYVEYKQEHQFN